EDLKNVEIPIIPSFSGSPGQPSGQASANQPQAGMQDQSAMQGQMTGQTPSQPQGDVGGSPVSVGIPTIKLKDIAEIKLIGKAESISRTNGMESIGIQIVKGADANTVEVANLVKKEAAKYED